MAFANLACGAVPTTWGKATSKALFVSILTCSYQLGPMSAMLNASYMCTSTLGWQAVYYLYGILTIAIFTVFFVVYSNTPHKNWMTPKKVAPVCDNNAPKVSQKKQVIPYGKMVTTGSVWGIIVSAFADSIGYEIFLLYGPIYVNTVVKTEIQQTGVLAALPYLIAMIIKPVTGVFLDKAVCVSDYTRYIFFTGIVEIVGCIGFFALTLTSSNMTCLAVALFTIITILSVHNVGLMNISQIVAQQYTHVLSSIIAAQNSVVGLILPPVVAFCVPHYERGEWTAVFYGICSVLIVANIIFITFTKARGAPFTQVAPRNESSTEDIKQSEYDAYDM
ncbi:hypothetical protein QR680_010595 [Steinernema hermaphroditum]|uniref:Major facilitator superfamily (MFS) profile domain-containing protein n=1 Tax=Steinernema hermaphroditum TaxID=289476 RepID=A0AA39MBH6_9BILA|nr:hypothetical protein QR680_010595 [Steinernema hermaphroditum]